MALKQALTSRQPAPSMSICTDRSSQYTGQACRPRIEGVGVLASYARSGNLYDKAQAEAGWSNLKQSCFRRVTNLTA